MDIAEQKIRDFRAHFIPDISHPEANLRVTAHGLLYDFKGYFPDVKFTVAQLQACFDAYLQLIDPLMQYIAQSCQQSMMNIQWRLLSIHLVTIVPVNFYLLIFLGQKKMKTIQLLSSMSATFRHLSKLSIS